MNNGVATAREALIAQLTGEIDALVRRIEAIEPLLAQACDALAAGASDMQDGEARFKAAATAFADQARDEVTRIVTIRTADLLRDELQGHERTIRDAAALAMRDTIDDVLKPALLDHAKRLNAQRSRWAPTWYLLAGACVGSVLTMGVAVGISLFR